MMKKLIAILILTVSIAISGDWVTVIVSAGAEIVADCVQIIFDGNSLTAGSGATAGNDYPSVVMDNYSENWARRNIGKSGQTLRQMIDSRGDVPEVLTGIVDNIYICWGGHNDFAGGADVDTVLKRTEVCCSLAQTDGYTVIVMAMLPSTYSGQPAKLDSMRCAYNDSLRAQYSGWADAMVELDQDADIGQDGDQNNTTFYSADKIHLTNAGYAIVADSVIAEVDSLLGR
jgi:lysophospholipase L1-like esterase